MPSLVLLWAPHLGRNRRPGRRRTEALSFRVLASVAAGTRLAASIVVAAPPAATLVSEMQSALMRTESTSLATSTNRPATSTTLEERLQSTSSTAANESDDAEEGPLRVWTVHTNASSIFPAPEYRPSSKGCLMFVHIPKTAGTTIEESMAAARQKHPSDWRYAGWGAQDKNLTCREKIEPNGWFRCRMRSGAECSAWHVPPSQDELLRQAYERCDTFCVPRHPVSRLVSEWHFHRGDDSACDFQAFAQWAQGVAFRPEHARQFDADCHLMLQSEYLPGCQHVVRYEHLNEDFPRLMKAYGLDVNLTGHKFPGKECTNWTIQGKLLAQIRRWYAADFEAFGYE
mmetsp:Transcript_117908/g.338121  ORF Transcript_117908/g.338121 Transcript_117908/m.338121 type:complete len:343 (+) Transcript_117908:106-1134(+)